MNASSPLNPKSGVCVWRLLLVMMTIGFLLNPGGRASAEEYFSCPFYSNAACLSLGETVCSTSGKCVKDSSICFDQFECNYMGFVCKSNYNELVDDYNELLDDYDEFLDDYDELLDDYDELLDAANALSAYSSALEDCITQAATMEDVRLCQ